MFGTADSIWYYMVLHSTTYDVWYCRYHMTLNGTEWFSRWCMVLAAWCCMVPQMMHGTTDTKWYYTVPHGTADAVWYNIYSMVLHGPARYRIVLQLIPRATWYCRCCTV